MTTDQQVVHDPLTTKEGWQRFVDEPPTPPPLPSRSHHQQLEPWERTDAEKARLDYHARLITVATPTIRQVVTTGHRLVLLNRGQVSARRGLILTGQAATGKTTALTQLGRSHELQLRRRSPDAHTRIPVIYVTVPPGATPRILAAEFARFLGLPVPRRFNQADITNAVCDVCCATGCDLVLVDELHNLSLHTRAGAEASDQLKYLSERIPATFVYAGIDLEGAGLFTGIRGRQIAGRFSVIQSLPFAYATKAQRQEWRALVVSLEQALRLRDHRPGTLLRHAAYLYQRTAGMIGSLSHLLRGAAIEAIRTGTEKLTKPLLDTIPLDHHAEQASTPRRRRPRQAARRA